MPIEIIKRSKRNASWIPDTHPYIALLDMMSDEQAPILAWAAETFGPQGDRWFVDGDRIFLASTSDLAILKRQWI